MTWNYSVSGRKILPLIVLDVDAYVQVGSKNARKLVVR